MIHYLRLKLCHLNQNAQVNFPDGTWLIFWKYKVRNDILSYSFHVVFHGIAIGQLLVLFYFSSGRSGQGKLAYVIVLRTSKTRILVWKAYQNYAPKREYLKWTDFSQHWVCSHEWHTGPNKQEEQLTLQQNQTRAVQESGTDNRREPLVGIFRQKTWTACNVLIIFKTKHVVKYARGLAAFQRLRGTKFPSFNHAVSMNHHL